MDYFGVTEQMIEQELSDAKEQLKNDQSNLDVIELVDGLKKTAEKLQLIKLIEEWVRTKQFDK